ncbi:hypothetical protein ACLBKS_03540 [Hylemonella sp. W303a]|uniref:hypothetical protein n=1 Tax=Hylemonella sp. W303a TaxID=3389873 RepID=UPI00396B03F6
MTGYRKVLDISYARDQRLAEWLKKSKHHQVILPEYFAVEALNVRDDLGVAANFEILGAYPDQVLLAKPMSFLCQLAPKQMRKSKNLIDALSTKNFTRLSRRIISAKSDPDSRLRIQEAMYEAGLYIESLSPAGDAMKEILSGWLKTFRESDIRALRKENEWTPEFRHNLLMNLIKMSDIMLSCARPEACPRTLPELLFSINFVFPLCLSVRAVHRRMKGDPKDIGEKSHRSDLIDSTYCTLALYFDGLLTHDMGAQRTFNQARNILGQLKEDAPRFSSITYEKDW